ncbi:MAG: protein jag [Gracilibacteraceae bacterium]|nr:protein jag [Gracilibacteraceae bacterium]
MKIAEKSARTIEDAVAACLAELGGVSAEDVEIEVLEEPGKGLFGLFGGRPARVRVSLPENREEAAPDKNDEDGGKPEKIKRWRKTAEDESVSPEEKAALYARQAEIARELLSRLLKAMSVEADIEVFCRENGAQIKIAGDDVGVLIGRRGETMDALQFLINLAVARQTDARSRVLLDVGGYRQRREETLINLAKRMADKVKRTNSRVTLEPMISRERRVIHMTLQNDWKLTTFSEGEEPNRRVVIAPKRGGARGE